MDKPLMVVSLVSIVAYTLLAAALSSTSYSPFSMTSKELAPGSSATPMPTPPGPCKWFVSPAGSFDGNGSLGSPWSLKRLFGGDPGFGGVGPPTAIHPGDNICLRGGTYSGLFQTILAGTPGHQITVRPYPGEHVIIDSATATPNVPNTSVAGVVIGSEGNQFGYVTVRDLEITDSYSTNRQDARPDGVYIKAPGVKLINNIIHDVGNGIFHNTSANDSELYGNLIYNAGWDDRTNGLFQGGTGHGMYAANTSGFLRVYNNIITTSLGAGFHFYSAGGGNLNNIDLQDNVSFNNGYWTRYHDSPYASEGRATDNFLIGHRPVIALNFVRNYGYHREGRGTQNLELGYSGTENISATAKHNTIIGGINNIDHFETLVFTDNYIATANRLLYYSPPTINTSITINNNKHYFYSNSANSRDCAAPFAVINTETTTGQWRALGFDANSTIHACGVRDANATVTINPNIYDANRYHVIVNNPAGTTTVSLNLSSALTKGDSFELHNAQDYYGPLVASGTYDGPISINMTTLKVATLVAYGRMPNLTPLAQMTSGPQFGAFVLIKRLKNQP